MLITVSIYAQEMQLSGGFDFAFGVFKVNNDFWFKENYPINNYYFINEKTTSAFFAFGLSFTLRVFPDTDKAFSTGFIFRDRAIIMTNIKQSGTFSINNYSQSISETYTLKDDLYIGTMDFGLGSSYRYKISNGLQFCGDLGINLTILDSEDTKTSEKLDYLGIGIFSDLAFQINFTPNLYLELGLNSIINIFSSQKGEFPYNRTLYKYEDTGRWDLISTAAYIQIGWRLDLQNIRNY
jgi:hypothetical protein